MRLFHPYLLIGLAILSIPLGGFAQQDLSLPKLYPSYFEDFSALNSYPSLCFEQAFWDKNGKLWLIPCPGSRHTNAINLFQFDGYSFKFVRGDWEKINTGANFHGIYKGQEIVGLAGSDENPDMLFFHNIDTDQLRIYDLRQYGLVKALSLTPDDRIFLVIAKDELWYFYEWLEEELREINHIKIPPEYTEAWGFRDKNQFLSEDKFMVKYGKHNFITSIDIKTGKTNKIYATEFPVQNTAIDTSLTAWESTVLKGVGGNYFFLDYEGLTERLLIGFNTETEQFEPLHSVPNDWLLQRTAKDQAGNKLFVFKTSKKQVTGILEDSEGKRFDYSPLLSSVRGLDNARYYSPNFKDQVVIMHQEGIIFQRIKSESAIRHFMPGQSIRGITELPDGRFLIGTQSFGDFLLDIQTGNYSPFKVPGCFFQYGGLRSTFITDPAGNIWANSPKNIFQYSPKQQSCVAYPWEGSEIQSFIFINPSQLAIVDKSWKLSLYDLVNQTQEIATIEGDTVQFNGYVHDFIMDKGGNLWFATVNGFWKLNFSTNEFGKINEELPFLDDRFLSIDEDESGKIWLGSTLGGLHIYKPKTNEVQILNSESGLGNNTIATIQKDDDGDRWLGTYNGISIVSPEGRLIANINLEDGLINKENNRYASYKTSDGRLLMGTVAGLNLINPREIKRRFAQHSDLKIYLTSLSYTPPKSDERIRQLYGLQNISKIVLPASKRNIDLSFALSNYFNPELNHYAYQLEGIDEDWTFIGNQPFLSLNNLPAGRYNLLIKGSDPIGNWTSSPVSISIYAREYIQNQPWFYWLVFFVLAAIGAGVAMIWIQQLRSEVRKATSKIQKDKELIEDQAAQLLELDKAKSQFFTNISHEFRTPLTIISGMAGQLMENPQAWARKGGQMIKQNSANLLNLVNQILDLRKLEAKELKLNMVQGDVVRYLQYLSQSYAFYAQSKGLQLHFLPAIEKLVMDFDPEKLLRIISNLLSNAVKYTPDAGNIYLHLNHSIKNGQTYLQLRVEDTGTGIPSDQLPKIFGRFYQAGDSHSQKREGTGIGLALTQELVHLMKGSIDVKSTPGKGTTFSVLLPVTNDSPVSEVLPRDFGQLIDPESPVLMVNPDPIKEEQASGGSVLELPTLLIVEDNPDIRQFLVACLENNYQLETAANGQQGIDLALEIVPDLIISDVMMPEKDGFELCETLKNDERTSHIPIILLTAKADMQSKISGLKTGADAYLTKPFEQEELLVRLENLFELRQKLQARYQSLASKVAPQNKEDEFVQKVRQAVLTNLPDETFGIAQLCRAVGLSRAQLHNKLKALTGLSASHFIRSIRLHKAKELLQSSDMNVSEVGYEVGFKNPSHFSSAYQGKFGISPSKTRK